MKRLKTDLFDAPTIDRIRLIVDEQRPLDLARTGSAVFDFLERQGDRFRCVPMTAEIFALLDAMEAVAGLAKSGDLTSRNIDGSLIAISELEVRRFYHESHRYLKSPLLREILSGPIPESTELLTSDDSGISLDVIASTER